MNTKFLTILAFAISISIVACKSNEQATRDNSSNQRGKGPMSVDQIFETMDTNNDDKLSKDEAKGPIANDFSSIDTDEDGFITKTELEAAPKPTNNRGGGQRGGGMR